MGAFNTALASLRAAEGGFEAQVDDTWLQGRSLFGGLQAALAVRAMRALLPAEMPLRTLQVTFLAPVPAGRVNVRAQILRAGKNATHVQAQLVEGDQTLCLLIGIFGARRESVIARVPALPEGVPAQKPIVFAHIPGLTPSFTQHFRVRWLDGGLPYSGAAKPSARLEVGLSDEGPALAEHVLAIADFIPPIGLNYLRKPAPGSSMTWMVDFLSDDYAAEPLAAWRVDADMTAAAHGYTQQSCLITVPSGAPVALSRQNMVVFG